MLILLEKLEFLNFFPIKTFSNITTLIIIQGISLYLRYSQITFGLKAISTMHSQFLWNHSKQHDILQFACQICTLSWDFERKSKDAFSISIRQSKKKKKKKEIYMVGVSKLQMGQYYLLSNKQRR